MRLGEEGGAGAVAAPAGAPAVSGRAQLVIRPARRAGPDERLRVALLTYRGNRHCGGQGVYVRELAHALRGLGHVVEVFSGPPYPDLHPGTPLTRVPSLDLYRSPDPFRLPGLGELRDPIDVLELLLMSTAAFPEPLTYSLRVWRGLRRRLRGFDVVHDNQVLGWGLLGLLRDGIAVLGTVHHPITVDRRLDLAHAATLRRRLLLRRWYSFVPMQVRVARRLPLLVTPSESSRADVETELGVGAERVVAVPLGVDTARFRPLPEVRRVPDRLISTASADVPLKGLRVLVEALGRLRRSRAGAHLVVVGRLGSDSDVGRAIDAAGVGGAVSFRSGVAPDELVRLYAEAEIAVVPSLYEGFSLPAAEAMACGLPLVATTAGAVPEVAGRDGETCLAVPPGDPARLAAAIARALDDPRLRRALGQAAMLRIRERFTWEATARATVEQYRRAIELSRC